MKSEISKKEMPDLIEEMKKKVPSGWRVVEVGADGLVLENWKNLLVILTIGEEQDGKEWLHVSMSYKTKMPDYKDMLEVKNAFIGKYNEAYQIFPKESKKINLHKYCLHLFSCLDGPALPDFTRGSGSL
jgi:hypothetical protein